MNNYDIDTIIIKKKEILSEINIYQKKLITLETELLEIEKKMANFSETNINDSLSLSEQQRTIVESKHKNILVVACPGSGKTHTLISRYVHLITKEKIEPSKIILITFTKKAGMEMNQRISNILPHRLPYYVGSLHGLGFKLLQEYNKISYTVLDENDSHILLRKSADNVLNDSLLEDDEKELLRKQIIYIYDKVSTNYPLNLTETIKQLSISAKYKTIITNILKEYKSIKKNQDIVDFNDLMIQFCQLLGTKKINSFLENIKYVFFDEYQDVNSVQNYILSSFKQNSNIMVVGDDAQAIYAFRGSSIRYIWDFEENFPDDNKKYFLETNYRSTPSIVNFFQDIISHNVNQYTKNVKSYYTELGMKPYIMCHNTFIEQYKWVADDIYNKYKSGIPLQNMVVLSRKNSSLDMLEHELITRSIPVVKSIGISLLNKQHIKDFIAFLIILTNPKSLIHWKRILSLHKYIGLTKANDIINGININDIMNGIKNNNHLSSFYTFLININNKSIKEQLNMVQTYLFTLWENNNEKNIDSRKEDIVKLLMYMNKQTTQTISDFINQIHLNLEIESYDDCLFLSTVHGSKGLEWEYVYIIDMDCKNFPNVRQAYYKEEMDNVMEERRLFYVAASRAKKYLSINFAQDINNASSNIIVSPFVRELDINNFLSSNLTKTLSANYDYTGNISIDVNNYLRYNGYNNLIDVINIPSTRENIGLKIELPVPITIKNRLIAGNMMDILISKMIYNNYSDIIEHFDLTINNHNKVPEKIYHNYVDKYTDWRNILNDIFYIATYRNKNNDTINIEEWKQYLLSSDSMLYYNNIEKCIIKLIDKLMTNNNKILIHTSVSHGSIKGEIDFMINDTLIEMKTTPDEACTFPNVCQTLMYAHLLAKKNIVANKIIVLNLWDGTIDTFDINDFNHKKFRKILYNV